MTKLYDRTFGVDAADRRRDAVLAARLAALQFLRPDHLEIATDFADDSALLLAHKEIKKINLYKVGGAVLPGWVAGWLQTGEGGGARERGV